MKLLGVVLVAAAPLLAQWTQLSSTAMTAAICPANGASGSVTGAGGAYPYQSQCNTVIRAWGGGAARTLAGSEELYIWGGGHGDYAGNEMYRLNLHATPPAMERITEPSQVLQSDAANSDSAYSDGRPRSRHTYGWLAYIDHLDKVFVWGGSNYGVGTNARDGWLFDPSNLASPWTAITPSAAGGCVDPTIYANYLIYPSGWSVYNPADQLVYIINSSGWLFKLNLATSCYTASSMATQPSDTAMAVLDSTRNRFFLIGGSVASGSHAYTITTTGTVTDVTNSVDVSCNGLFTYGPGLFYDATRDRVIGYPLNGGNTVYELNPTDYTCTTSAPNGGPAAGSNVNGTYGRWAYFPSLAKALGVNDFGQNAYTFAYPPTASGSNVSLRGSVQMK